MSVGRVGACAGHREAKVLDVPGGVPLRVRHVEGEVLEFHRGTLGSPRAALKLRVPVRPFFPRDPCGVKALGVGA